MAGSLHTQASHTPGLRTDAVSQITCCPWHLALRKENLHAGEDAALWVEEADGSAVAVVTEDRQLEALKRGLNRRGMRERALLGVLKRRQKLLAESMSSRALDTVPDVLQQTDRSAFVRLQVHIGPSPISGL